MFFHAEVSKIWTTPALRRLLVAMVLAMPVLAAFVGLSRSLQPQDTVVAGALTGSILTAAIAAVWGALVITVEHGSGTIVPSLSVLPDRWRFFGVKALVVAVTAGTVTLVSGAAAIAVGRLALHGSGHPSGQVMPGLLGIAAGVTALAVFGLGVGALLRSSAGSVALILALLILPDMLSPLLGDYRYWLSGAAPGSMFAKLALGPTSTPEYAGGIGGWPALAVTAVYGAVVAVIAARQLAQSDI